MAITASLVKELRERTGSGMMECKKALVETDGDIEAAAELMRKSGAAKADKKAGRVAADGAIKVMVEDGAKAAVILEINSETDFVAKDDNFQAFADQVLDGGCQQQPAGCRAIGDATTGIRSKCRGSSPGIDRQGWREHPGTSLSACRIKCGDCLLRPRIRVSACWSIPVRNLNWRVM